MGTSVRAWLALIGLWLSSQGAAAPAVDRPLAWSATGAGGEGLAFLPEAGAAAEVLKEPLNSDVDNTKDFTYSAHDVDVFDFYRSASRVEKRNPTKFTLCGMHVLARARDADGRTHEWDLKLSVFNNGGAKLAGIAAGAFLIQPKSRTRLPRGQIKTFAIGLDDTADSASAGIASAPNPSGSILGDFPETFAEKLFDAFDAGTPFTIDLTYSSGEHEAVHARALGGIGRNQGGFFHGSDAPSMRCLRELVPAAPSGSQDRIVEAEHSS
jgi:hypothetical protein